MIPIRRLLASSLFLVLVVYLTLSPTPVLTQEGPVIAILDMERIFTDSKAATSLREEIDKQRLAYRTTLHEQENALRTVDQALVRQRAVLSAETFAAKRKELQEQANRLQQDFVSRQKEMEELFGRGIREVRKALAEVAKEIADERGISLILMTPTIVLANRELDITEEVLRRLDERLPSANLAAPDN
jgi:Skp family chaperone for outer membrane proteins